MATRKKSAKKPDGLVAVTQDRLLGVVHQVWLAGLGAVSKAQSGAPKLLDDLVAEGARVQAQASKATEQVVRSALDTAQTAVRGRVDDMREKTTDAFENLEKVFQNRVHRALKQLGVPSSEEIAGLTRRVDALNENIGNLAQKRSRVAPKLAQKRTTSGKRRAGAARKSGGSHTTAAH
jgi:poly(hydroxyalkanoate) granule-associated protein